MDVITSTFYITYVFLITTGTITFIEAIRTKDPTVRHVMNLETCISIIAAFFYSTFVDIVKASDAAKEHIPFDKVNLIRYTDWFISTPFMLFVLCMVLANERKVNLKVTSLLIVLLLNYAMLISGYMGETRVIERSMACAIGFVFFGIMFGYIWTMFMSGQKVIGFASMLSFGVFLSVWAMYGIVFLLDEKTKNVAFNILDLIAKAFVGIFFWMYFTNAVVF